MPVLRFFTHTPLQGPLLPLQAPSEKPYYSALFMIQFALHLRKPRQHTAFLALLSLILLTSYVLLVHCPNTNASLALRSPDVKFQPSQLSPTSPKFRMTNLVAAPPVVGKQVQLTKDEELAAVTSFLASLPQNQLLSSIDPLSPIDPQLVLDFDARSSRASQEVQAMVEDVWSKNPVFLYSKHYSSASRRVKAVLDDLYLIPPPTIIDVDTRDDAEVLIPLLHRLTSTEAFPILIIAGKLVGTSQDDIIQMDHDGTLQQLIIQSGVMVNGARKNKRKH